jgi:hypothetical protein
MAERTGENVLSAVIAGAAFVGGAASVTGAIAASGTALGVAAFAGGIMIAANVSSRLVFSDRADAAILRGAKSDYA